MSLAKMASDLMWNYSIFFLYILYSFLFPALGDGKNKYRQKTWRKLSLSACFPVWCCVGQLPQAEGLPILQPPQSRHCPLQRVSSHPWVTCPAQSDDAGQSLCPSVTNTCRSKGDGSSICALETLKQNLGSSFWEWKSNPWKGSSAALWNGK